MRRRLLVVEDDHTLRQALSFNLVREGYEVSGVATGEAALDAARQAVECPAGLSSANWAFTELVEAAARPAEWVMAAVVGFAGLESTLVAARRGAMVALANKEALVCAGRLLIEAIEESGGALLPVESTG